MRHVQVISSNRPAPAQLESIIQIVGLMQTLIFLPLNVSSSLLSQGQQLTSLLSQWSLLFGLDLPQKNAE